MTPGSYQVMSPSRRRVRARFSDATTRRGVCLYCEPARQEKNVTHPPAGRKGWSILSTIRKPVLLLLGALALSSIVGSALLPADAEACGAKSDNNRYYCGNGTFTGCHFYDTTCEHVQGQSYV